MPRGQYIGIDTSNAEADARLISAAPDLLGAAVSAEDEFTDLLEFARMHGWQTQNEEGTLRRLRAAIAKAVGGEVQHG